MRKCVSRCALILCVASSTAAWASPRVLAVIDGKATCKAVTADQESQRASLRLVRTGMGTRLLEVETEKYRARGPAAQVEHKETGEMSYFLAFGDRGAISARFKVSPAGAVTTKLEIVVSPPREAVPALPDGAPPKATVYGYDCVKAD